MNAKLDVQREGPARPADDLHEAEAPAAALRDVFLQAFRREAERQSAR